MATTETSLQKLRIGEPPSAFLLEEIRNHQQLLQKERDQGWIGAGIRPIHKANTINYNHCHWHDLNGYECQAPAEYGIPVVASFPDDGIDVHLCIATCLPHFSLGADLAHAIVEEWRLRTALSIHREVHAIRETLLQGQLQRRA